MSKINEVMSNADEEDPIGSKQHVQRCKLSCKKGLRKIDEIFRGNKNHAIRRRRYSEVTYKTDGVKNDDKFGVRRYLLTL